MTEKLVTAGLTVLLGIIGVAILAVLVSKQSDTTNVISAGSWGFGCALKTAITGTNQCGGNTPSVTSGITFPPVGRVTF